MSVREQIINDINLLPEQSLKIISVIIEEIKTSNEARPVYGSGKGMMWIADDFDAPLEEMGEYM